MKKIWCQACYLSKIKKTVLLIGGSGFVGRRLGTFLHAKGCALRVMSRRAQLNLPYPAQTYRWTRDGAIPAAALAEVDVVINLAGASVAEGRWSRARKAEIIASRVQDDASNGGRVAKVVAPSCGDTGGSSRLLRRTRRAHTGRGQCGGHRLSRQPPAQQWEAILTGAQLTNRWVIMRLGMVLGEGGGALRVLRQIYRLGFGASLGSGKQYVSWVHSDDICGFEQHVLQDNSCRGIYQPYRATGNHLRHAASLLAAPLPPCACQPCACARVGVAPAAGGEGDGGHCQPAGCAPAHAGGRLQFQVYRY